MGRRRLHMHFLFIIMARETLSFTVQPKAGRWMKLGYFGIEVYIHQPSSLGLDGETYCIPLPGGWMKFAHKISAFSLANIFGLA